MGLRSKGRRGSLELPCGGEEGLSYLDQSVTLAETLLATLFLATDFNRRKYQAIRYYATVPVPAGPTIHGTRRQLNAELRQETATTIRKTAGEDRQTYREREREKE